MNTPVKPTIGLALSGSGSRLVFYIGFLEELQKAGIPIDYIAACSGGAIVAACYACGTLQELRDFVFTLDVKSIRNYLVRGKGGLYSFDGAQELGERFFKNLKFEEVRPLMGFVAVDLEDGKQVVMSMGDIYHAVKVSCAVPAVIEPVKWGGMTLIDGGLLNIVPVDVLRQAGVDISIGVNMRGNKHIFTEGQMTAKKFLNIFKKVLFVDYWGKLWGSFLNSDDFESKVLETPGLFKVLGRSLDLAIEASKKDYTMDLSCDLMITPDVAKFKLKNFESSSAELYELGRMTAIQHVPSIRKIINEKSKALAAVGR